MQNLHGISGIPPSSAEIGAAAHNLERAEFDGAPELQPREYASELDHFLAPKHPKLSAYIALRDRIATGHRSPKIDTARPRKSVDAARARYESWCRSFQDRVQHREQCGLRRLVDAYFGMTMARSDLASLEYQAKRLRTEKRADQRAAKDAEHAAESKKFGDDLAAVCLKVVREARHGR